MCAINSALGGEGDDPSQGGEGDDPSQGENPSVTLLRTLNDPRLSLRSVTEECANEYFEKLQQAKEKKRDGGCVAGWAELRSKEGHTFYYNEESSEHSWTRPDDYQGNPLLMTKEEVQVSGCGL